MIEVILKFLDKPNLLIALLVALQLGPYFALWWSVENNARVSTRIEQSFNRLVERIECGHKVQVASAKREEVEHGR